MFLPVIKSRHFWNLIGWGTVLFLLAGCSPSEENYYRMARIHQAQGRRGEAYNCLKKALEICPSYRAARKLLSSLTDPHLQFSSPAYPDNDFSRGRKEMLNAHLQKMLLRIEEYERDYQILELSGPVKAPAGPEPEHFPLLIELDREDIGVAFITIEDYQKLLREISDYGRGYLYYQNPYLVSGIILGRRGLLVEAVQNFKTALDVDPENAKIYNNLAVTYFRMGRLQLAEKCYQQALQREPHNIFSHINLGLTYLKTGRAREAEKKFKWALYTNPYDPRAHSFLAYLYSQQNELERAEKHYREILYLHPSSPRAYYGIGSLKLKQRAWDDAIDYFQRAVELQEDYLDAYLGLAAAYNRKGRYGDAEKVLREALVVNPDYAPLYYNLACIYALQKKKIAAINNLELALEKGFREKGMLLRDPDLEGIRDEPSFQKLLQL